MQPPPRIKPAAFWPSRVYGRGDPSRRVTAGFVLGRMSALPLSEPDRFTSLHRHAMLCQDGDDEVD